LNFQHLTKFQVIRKTGLPHTDALVTTAKLTDTSNSEWGKHPLPNASLTYKHEIERLCEFFLFRLKHPDPTHIFQVNISES
jgi:hypothetical protein